VAHDACFPAGLLVF